jgi:hypothetical protein
VGILKKFSMTECKSTLMDLKKMNDNDSDEIDPQLIGSLMYLVNTRLEFARICRMDRKYSGSEEHIRLLSHHEDCHDFLMQRETKLYSLEYHKRRVCNIKCAKQYGFRSL